MTENEKDSGSVAEMEGVPNPPISERQNAQHDSDAAAKLQSTLDSLAKKLDEANAHSRTQKSENDRGVAQTRKEVGELKRQIAEYERLKGSGLEVDAAVEEVTFRDEVRALREQLSKLNPAQTEGTGNTGGKADPVAEVIKKANVNANDAGVLDLVREFGNDPMAFAIGLGKYKATLGPPDASAAPTMQNTSVASTEDRESLKRGYVEEMKKARGNRAEGNAVQDKYRKKGLDIEHIGFNL